MNRRRSAVVAPYRVQEITLCFRRSRRRTFKTNSSADVAKVFEDLSNEVRECFYAAYLNGENEVIGVERVSAGTISWTYACHAEVLRTALLVGARALIVVHNHPSGNPRPSQGDLDITEQLTKAAEFFRITLLLMLA